MIIKLFIFYSNKITKVLARTENKPEIKKYKGTIKLCKAMAKFGHMQSNKLHPQCTTAKSIIHKPFIKSIYTILSLAIFAGFIKLKESH